MNSVPTRSPMLILLAAFVAGVVVGMWIDLPTWVAIVCAAVCYGVAAWRSRGAEVALLLAIAMTGVAAARSEYGHVQPPINKPITAILTIDDNPTDRVRYNSASATISWFRTESDDAEADDVAGTWQRSDRRVLLATDTTLQLAVGERIMVTTKLRPIVDSVGSYARLMATRGYVGRMSIYGTTPVERLGEGSSLRTLSRRLQNWGANRLNDSRLEGDARALCSAIATGIRTQMSAPLREAYVRSGTAHLLAVSGLHVAIVFALANLILRWLVLLRHGNRLLSVAVVIVVAGYAAMSGWSVSVVRAALMFGVLQLASVSGANYRSINTLAAVVLLMLAVRPSLICDVSFQLSTTAVAAILYWAVPLCARLRTRSALLNAVVSTVVIGAVCTLATLPLVAYWFGRASVVGVVLNQLVILIGYPLVALSIMAVFMPSTWVAVAAGAVAEAENRCVVAAAQLDWASCEVSLSAWGTVAIYVAAIVISELARVVPRKNSLSLPYV